MTNFSHRIKAQSTTIGFNHKTQQSEVHRAGCGHESKLEGVRAFDGKVLADDFFNVAPCAR